MEALRVLRQISRKTAPGRPPAFSEAHALKALELIGSGQGIGRQQLSRELDLGEGTIRTLIRRMKEMGLVNTSRGGMSLTGRGKRALGGFRGLLRSTEFPETPITVGSHNHSVLVRGAAGRVRKGVEQRDAALIAGARGATTLLCTGGRLKIPGMELDLDPATREYILERLRPDEGDAIIIGSADDALDAELGAKSAALKLLEELESP